MHDLALDAIKTVSDKKRVRETLLLTCIDLTTAGVECVSRFWLDDRLDFARCSASWLDFRWLGLGNRAISSGEPPEEHNFQTQIARRTPPL